MDMADTVEREGEEQSTLGVALFSREQQGLSKGTDPSASSRLWGK